MNMKRMFLIVMVACLAAIGFTCVATADPEDVVLTIEPETSWKGDVELLKAEVKPCALYSVTENQITYATSIQILGYKGFELNGVYSTDKNMAALGIGYEIANLKDLGVDVPLAKYIDLSVGGYIGSRDFTSEDRASDWGVWATIVKIDF